MGMHTLKKQFDFGQLACIVQLSEIFSFLRQVLPLSERISLMCNEVRCDGIELGDK